MLVAIVSDTHLPRGGRRLPGACLEPLREAELILHAGDFVSARALAELETLGPPVAAVHGNIDSEAYTTSFFSRFETVVAYGLAVTSIRRFGASVPNILPTSSSARVSMVSVDIGGAPELLPVEGRDASH